MVFKVNALKAIYFLANYKTMNC